MNQNYIHFLYTMFTGLGLHNGYRGDRWFKNRIEIFKQYTMKSVLNQTNRNFVHWISFRPEEQKNPLTWQLQNYLKGIENYRFIFTFGGLCFWDDKYPNDNLEERLKATLPELKDLIGDKEFVLMTLQPSDDMYETNAVEGMQNAWPGNCQAMGFRNGYILNAKTHQIAEYNPDTIPPFFTIKFRRETFLNPSAHYAYTGPYKSHEYVKDHLRFGEWKERGFCVLVHGENISSNWNSPFRGKIIDPNTHFVEGMLEDRFGLKGIKPLKIRKRPMLILRGLFNRLPFNRLIYKVAKKIYYK